MSARALRNLRRAREPELPEADVDEEDMLPGLRASSVHTRFRSVVLYTTSASSDEETPVQNPKPKKPSKKKKTPRTKPTDMDDLQASLAMLTINDGLDSNTSPEEARMGVLSRNRKKKQKNKEARKINNTESELEGSLMEINLQLGELTQHDKQLSSKTMKRRPILYVENRFLDPICEIKQERKSRPKIGQKYFSRLATPKVEWPFLGKPPGLSMKIIDKKDGEMYFAYNHGGNYQEIQHLFLDAIDTPRASNLFQYLNECPFHVDTLIQCANMSMPRNDPDFEMDLISRALYYLENAAHASFSFSQGNCRLEYIYQENRSFHIALFKRMSLSLVKSANRTGLELCKLGMSLDRTDPLALILLVDQLALSCGEHEWLLRLFEEWNPTRNLAVLPNMAYSVALAAYHVSIKNGGDLSSAEAFLHEAIEKFPSLLVPLIESATFKICPEVRNYDYLKNAEDSITPSLDKLCKVYITRCSSLWRISGVQDWVEKVALRSVTSGRLDSQQAKTISKLFSAQPPLPILRHFLLARDLISGPFNMEEEIMPSNWDPYPPVGGVEKYYYRGMEVPTTSTQQNCNPALAFFQSILPMRL